MGLCPGLGTGRCKVYLVVCIYVCRYILLYVYRNIQTSQILRDETIINLQKENTILKTMLKKNTSLIGAKIKILPFNGTYMGDFDVSEETEGYIIQEISKQEK